MVEAHEREGKQRMEKQRIFIDDILSNENMNRAYKQVIKNKGAAGIDGMECNDLQTVMDSDPERVHNRQC